MHKRCMGWWCANGLGLRWMVVGQWTEVVLEGAGQKDRLSSTIDDDG